MTHTDYKSYKCDICDKAFIQQGNLQTHRLIHTDDQPYACDVCGKSFNHIGNLRKHQMIHTGDKLIHVMCVENRLIKQMLVVDIKPLN